MKCIGLLLLVAACGGLGSTPAHPHAEAAESHTAMAEDDDPPPPYDKSAVGVALIAERAAEARAVQFVADTRTGDEIRHEMALADLAVRRRFIATLEVCESTGRLCPPRLDEPVWPYLVDSEEDPKLDTPLRFDVDSWRKVTAELHGRACACRTLACIDSMDAMFARLEVRPMEDVQADDVASTSITRARECLFRLRGRKALPKVARD